uniref:Predicted protein n=1 Tax=Physcomitrium patens TaxID=3218 RepID=A9U5R4_PHYPA
MGKEKGSDGEELVSPSEEKKIPNSKNSAGLFYLNQHGWDTSQYMMQAEHCACMLRCISCGDAQRRTGAALHRFRMLRLRPWLELTHVLRNLTDVGSHGSVPRALGRLKTLINLDLDNNKVCESCNARNKLLVEYRCPISRIMDLPSGPFPRAYVNEETCRSVSDFSKLGIRRGGILARNRLRTIRALWHLPNSASSHGRNRPHIGLESKSSFPIRDWTEGNLKISGYWGDVSVWDHGPNIEVQASEGRPCK